MGDTSRGLYGKFFVERTDGKSAPGQHALGVRWGAGQPRRRTSASNWAKPLAWNKRAQQSGERRLVFCSSLADVFDNEVPADWRADLFRLILATPHLTWLLLTKRIGNVATMLHADQWEHLGNVWLGITVVNQEESDRDIPKLLSVPAAKRFVSYEPALGPVDWRFAFADGRTACCHVCGFRTNQVGGMCPNDGARLRGDIGIDWIIVGGESDQPGMKARPFDIEWARSTVRQCKAAGVACFVKQLGSNPAPLIVEAGSVRERLWLKDRAGADPAEWPEDLRVQEWPQ